MRPIRVGEIPRRIIAKAVLGIIGRDIEDAALKHHCQTVALQKTDQHDCQCAVHAVNGSSSSLVVTNGSVSTLGGHSAALGADTQLEDLLQQLL